MKYFILFISIWFFSCQNNSAISFDKIELESYVSKGPRGEDSSYIESYIVYNYTSNIESEKKIDSFVCSLFLNDTVLYATSWFVFYNHSKKTNLPYIEKHLKHWNGYAVTHDLILNYGFIESKFSSKSTGKNWELNQVYNDELNCN